MTFFEKLYEKLVHFRQNLFSLAQTNNPYAKTNNKFYKLTVWFIDILLNGLIINVLTWAFGTSFSLKLIIGYGLLIWIITTTWKGMTNSAETVFFQFGKNFRK